MYMGLKTRIERFISCIYNNKSWRCVWYKNFWVVCFQSSCLFNFNNELFLVKENIVNGWNKFSMSSKNLNAIYVQECKVTLFITLNWTKEHTLEFQPFLKCMQIFHIISTLISIENHLIFIILWTYFLLMLCVFNLARVDLNFCIYAYW